MERTDKEKLINQFSEKFKQAKAVILTDYRGLTVSDINGLRRQLKGAETDYYVAKNTLLNLAAKDTPYTSLSEYLEGPNAIAFSYNEVSSTAKVIRDFAKSKPKLEIKIAVIDGKVYDAQQIGIIADLPSREELLGKLLGTMNAVPTSFVTVLAGVPRKFVQVLAAIQQKKEETANA